MVEVEEVVEDCWVLDEILVEVVADELARAELGGRVGEQAAVEWVISETLEDMGDRVEMDWAGDA